ncbi:MAG TPA: L-fuculokinase [Bacteroidales bacterium]|nr:L-fuculokinase [Bacteroidales bacterium]
MGERNILVLDCGATNVRVVAVNEHGRVVAQKALPNNTRPDPNYHQGLIWDVDEIWRKFTQCSLEVCNSIDRNSIAAITITTFGVNGAPVDSKGNLLYPVISWQCQRTVPIMDGIGRYIDPQRLYELSGVGSFHFNTINTLIWLKEHRPKVLDSMEAFLFMPSIFIHRLTGNIVNDTTMLGTSMLTDIRKGELSHEILSATGLPNRFATIGTPGTIAGKLTSQSASELGVPKGIPVVLAGHDTQFALIGSGAGINEVVLSSGTWEILMARVQNLCTSQQAMRAGITNEQDALPNVFNTGIQWLGSGVLEWIKRLLYPAELAKSPNHIYDLMIEEASKASSDGIEVNIDFGNIHGSISNLGLHATRGQIYRATLEALALKTSQSLDYLKELGSFEARSVIVVGGGGRNRLWNQLRANALGIPLRIVKESECTVIGAAMFSQAAVGIHPTIHEAINALKPEYETIYPDNQSS